MSQDSHDEETPTGLYFRTIALVKQDNKHEFVRLFNRLEPINKERVILEICGCDAANCLAAILDGEVGDESDINYYLSDLGKNMPLHFAAREATSRIASLLLDKGFSADFRTDFASLHLCLKNALPLNVALYYCRYCVWVSHGWKSPIHQVIEVCQLSLYSDIIRVIARNTTEIKLEFFKYLKQGKVFEVGALLAIASDLIMSSSSTIDGENATIGFKNIMEMRQFLLAEISRSLGVSNNTELKEIKKTLRLLEIFDRIGDKLLVWDGCTNDLEEVQDLGERVASLIKDAAYDEKVEVEYDHDEVLRFCNSTETSLNNVKGTWKLRKKLSGRSFDNHTRKFSTKAHSPSWLEERSSRVDVPLPLPTDGRFLASKGARTKYVLSKKHASFSGAAFAKVVRHLRYL